MEGFQLYYTATSDRGVEAASFTDANQDLHGVLLGAAFSATGKPFENTSVDRFFCAKLADSDGRSVLRDLWGSYVCFYRRGQKFSALTDPTSAIPCHYMQLGGVLLIFSHLEACPFPVANHLSLNNRFLSLLMAYDKVQTGETCLSEISELPGGYRLDLTAGKLRTDCLWDPRDFAAGPLELTDQEAADRLRDCVALVVSAWASRFRRIVVNLSGGLDSSIVTSCMSGRDSPSLLAVHQVMDSEDRTEASFARETARHCGCAYTEVRLSAPARLPDLLSHPLSVRPYRQFLAPDLSKVLGEDILGDTDAIFTGQGGDHLLLESRSALNFADHLKLNGLCRATLAELVHAARLSGKSVLRVLQEAAPAALRHQQPSSLLAAIKSRRTAVNAHALTETEITGMLPEWITQSDGLPPAKFDQINTLSHLTHMRRPFDRSGGRPVIHPLISQPLIELCLRLPAWQLCLGGQSRGLARLAFSGAIPERVRRRMTKGSAGRYYRDQVSRHRDQLADALLDGDLVGRGIIARRDVESYLAERQDETHESGHMMLVYYVIEAWLRRWTLPR